MRELDSCYAVFEGGATAGWVRDYIEVKKLIFGTYIQRKTKFIGRIFFQLTETDRKVYLIARLGNGARKASVQIDNLLVGDFKLAFFF